MKTKSIITGSIVIAIIIVGIIFFSQSKNIVDQIDSYDIFQVECNGEDITKRVDCDVLGSIVSKYKCSRLPHKFAPIQTSQVEVEINGTADRKPLHILLGDINVVYRSADKGGYTIQNSEGLLTEILHIIQ